MHDLEPQDIGDIFKQINNHQMNALMVMSQHKIKDENIIIKYPLQTGWLGQI